MLARLASNLFWMGRFIERAEHVARFTNVNYFSSLDNSNYIPESRQFMLESLLFMVGEINEDKQTLDNNTVLFDIGLNLEKDFSIYSCIKEARDNANCVRDLISTELYEAINKLYYFIGNYSRDYYLKKGLYDFTTSVTEATAVIKAKIRSTLLNDQISSIIKMGIYLERGNQVVRILNTKIYDVELLKFMNLSNIDYKQEWITLLNCVEGYDMIKRVQKKPPNDKSTVDFLIFNSRFPKSLVNNLYQVCKEIEMLNISGDMPKDSAPYLANKVYDHYKYLNIDEIKMNDIPEFLGKIQSDLFAINKKLEKDYFS